MKFNVSVFISGVKDFKVDANSWEEARKIAEGQAKEVLVPVQADLSVVAEEECDFDSMWDFEDDEVLECGLENPEYCESCQ